MSIKRILKMKSKTNEETLEESIVNSLTSNPLKGTSDKLDFIEEEKPL